MTPKKKGSEVKTGEPENTIVMDASVEIVEGELERMRVVMEKIQLQAIQKQSAIKAMCKEAAINQSKLVELMTCSCKKIHHMEGESSVGPKNKESSSGGSDLKSLKREALDEFRQSMKKVELPMFDGEDPVSWITRAEIYFRVQGTSSAMRVNLAQLCMEGATIHFFNTPLNDYDELTWEDLMKDMVVWVREVYSSS